MYLSIIIPAYNEEQRIGGTLKHMRDHLSSKDYEYEIIVVDDGSRDNTSFAAAESELGKSGKVKVIKNPMNRGKGFAVKRGILASEGKYVLLSDADMSTPLEEIDKLFDPIKNGFDVAIGS
ncbi:MAG: glycosyltransferase, partial [Candidatus Omnitrophica bacterium]|nr:glycosyltransferase [Candidatus Omnitrophota bacterium]